MTRPLHLCEDRVKIKPLRSIYQMAEKQAVNRSAFIESHRLTINGALLISGPDLQAPILFDRSLDISSVFKEGNASQIQWLQLLCARCPTAAAATRIRISRGGVRSWEIAILIALCIKLDCSGLELIAMLYKK